MSSNVTTLRRRPQSRGYLTVGSAALAPETSAYGRAVTRRRAATAGGPPPPVAVPRAPFVALVLLVVIGGVLGILLLNTKINENAFVLHDLRQQQAELNQRQQQLEEEIAVAASSVQLTAAANRLGLVRDGQPPHLWVPSGQAGRHAVADHGRAEPHQPGGLTVARPPRDPREPPTTRSGRAGGAPASGRRAPTGPRGRTVRELPARPTAGPVTRSGRLYRCSRVDVSTRARGVPRRTRKGDADGKAAPVARAKQDRRTRAAAKPSRTAPARARPPAAAKRGGSPPGGEADGQARARRIPLLGDPRRRLRLATVLALTMFLVLGARLVELQLTDGPAAAARAAAESPAVHRPAGTTWDHLRPQRRGAGPQRRGAFDLRRPDHGRGPGGDRQAALQPLLGVPASELADRMRPRLRADGSESRFEWLQRRVDISVGDAVAALETAGHRGGAGRAADRARARPGGEHHRVHRRRPYRAGGVGGPLRRGAARRQRASGPTRAGWGSSAREIPGGYVSETPAEPGSNLRLTLDMDLQYEVQRVSPRRCDRAGRPSAPRWCWTRAPSRCWRWPATHLQRGRPVGHRCS